MKQEIQNFINRRFANDNNWCNGNCYYFACILYARFGGLICYDTIEGHFVLKKDNKYYDWNGEYIPNSPSAVIAWNDFIDYDDLEYERIWRDCIS